MARLHARLRSALDARVQAWMRRRQGIDPDPVRLDRRRIYILPTPLGIAYAAMLFAMVLGGMNYGNNLGLGLAFLLVSLGLVVMHHCHGTLSGLRLRLAAAESGFVGGEVRFGINFENTALAPRPRIELGVGCDRLLVQLDGFLVAPGIREVLGLRVERSRLQARRGEGLARGDRGRGSGVRQQHAIRHTPYAICDTP